MRYCYEMCVDQGLVPAKPVRTATGKDLNTLMGIIRENCPAWEYWVYEGGEQQWYALDDLHFEEDQEYALSELGSFEWPGCVWDEPLMFAYNKWKHTGTPTPIVGLFYALRDAEE